MLGPTWYNCSYSLSLAKRVHICFEWIDMGPAQKNLALELQPTRRKILLALKKSGGMTATELSELLGMTSMGVRRHLTTLERDGLVMYDSQQRGLGRPSYLYLSLIHI